MHVLAFESRAAASRYAALLQEQDFDKLTATRWESEPLADFCWRADFGLGYVPPDARPVPPQRNHVDAAAIERRQEAALAQQQKSAGGARHWSEQPAEAAGMWACGRCLSSSAGARTDKLVFDIEEGRTRTRVAAAPHRPATRRTAAEHLPVVSMKHHVIRHARYLPTS